MSNGIRLKSTPKSVISERAGINLPIKLPSLHTMLAKFDLKRHGGEVMAFLPIGREVIPTV